MKRGYKLQEFVAHSSNVNCLKIGKKSSRIVVTGGEDNKVNLWAIGKPNSILSLSGHTSPVESVAFDSSEVLVVAGASSGTIKLWDLEEAKIVRTLTGHRSNCISVDFHPFGEFFASGSLDTNLKIWDIRRKGCIHTYKGHSRGVNAIRFTPDGRWVVSGGEDNVVKLWDLTAGKLLHDFKFHEGQIQCIDFHPHEFLLATGSADKTVKFWDLETFELIGSTAPEATGVRAMVFNPDGRTLFCGLHESLKVFSWEPVRCHDSVDMGWSKLADLNIHDGKLLGCSFNQSCVGVWVADISRVGPYAVGGTPGSDGPLEPKSFSRDEQTVKHLENSLKANSKSFSPARSPDRKETKTSLPANYAETGPTTNQRATISAASKLTTSNATAPANSTTLKRSPMPKAQQAQVSTRSEVLPVVVPRSSVKVEQTAPKVQSVISSRLFARSDVVPVIVPRNTTEESLSGPKSEASGSERPVISSKPSHLRKPSYSRGGREGGSAYTDSTTSVSQREEVVPVIVPRSTNEESLSGPRSETSGSERTLILSKPSHLRKPSYARGATEGGSACIDLTTSVSRREDVNVVAEKNFFSGFDAKDGSGEPSQTNHLGIGNTSEKFDRSLSLGHTPSHRHEDSDSRLHDRGREVTSARVQKGPGRTRTLVESWERRERSPSTETPTSSSSDFASGGDTLPSISRGQPCTDGSSLASSDIDDDSSSVIQEHDYFVNAMRTRLTKLQVVRRCWERNDVKATIVTTEKMSDHAVHADLISIFLEKFDIVTLEICTTILPLLTGLLGSKIDRHISLSFEFLLKLLTNYGAVIHSTISARLVGVDLEAEQRIERCSQCYTELQKIKHYLPSIIRKGGLLAKSAHELDLVIQEI